MDVHCTTCGEPWDAHHLWHDAVFQTALSRQEAEAWRLLPRSQRLNKRYREKFRAAGWEFGKTVINVTCCPCCPKTARPNPERLKIKAVLEEMFGGDEDGLASTFEEYSL